MNRPRIAAVRRTAPAATATAALTLLLLLAAAACAAAAPGPGRPDAGAWLAEGDAAATAEPAFPKLPPGAETLVLENGLKVLLLPNPAQPMAVVTTQVLVGSAYEDFRTSGMSHMLEHLLFNGTEKYSQEELYAAADRIGAWNNAHTGEFFTSFIMLVPSDALAEGIELQAQMLFHSTLPPDKFEKERGIVVGEIVQGRDRGGDFAGDTVHGIVYDGSSLALPTLGTLSTIEHMSRDDVWAFYRNNYVPNNMVTTVAGNFDRDAVLKLLRERFGKAAPGTVDRPVLAPAPFLSHTRAVTRRGGDEHRLSLVYEAPEYGSPDFFPFAVLTDLLTASGTGLLTTALDALPADARADVGVWWEKAPGFGRLGIDLSLPDGADPVVYRDLVTETLARALAAGIPETDVRESVRMQRTSTLLDREQLRMFAIMSAEPIAVGGVDFFLDYLDELSHVDAQEVARVLGAYLVDAPRLEAQVVPAAAPAVEDSSQSGVTVKRSVLSDGAVLVTLRNPASPLFAAHVTVRGRAVLDGVHPGALNLVHRLLLQGSGDCDAACLSHELRELGAVLKVVDDPSFPMDDYYTEPRFSWLRLETAADDGPDALALVLGLLHRPGFTSDDVAGALADQQQLLQRDAGSARWRADRLFATALFGDNPLSRPPEGAPGTLDGLRYDDLKKLAREAFAPANLVIAVVSPLAHDRVAAIVEKALPGDGKAAPAIPPAPVTAQDARVDEQIGGPMAAIRTGSVFAVDPADAPALEMLTAVLSDRLQMDLRETRGLSYSVGASLAVHGDRAELEAWLNPPSARAAEGEKALLDDVRGFDPASVTQDDLDAARGARVGRLMMRRLSSISQAYYLATAELDGAVDAYLTGLKAYAGVTTADLARVGAKYLAGRPLVTAVVD